MLALYRQGATLQQIGDRYGISRERVRQVLSKRFGICGEDGGKQATRRRFEEAKSAAKDRDSLLRYGCQYSEWKSVPSSLKRAYRMQKRSAAYRGIAFNLTPYEFVRLWRESGKLSQRGRGRDKFCMSRINDSGGYEVGNVQFITNAENIRLYQLERARKPKIASKTPGVYLMYPGYKKPYVARYGKKHLGFFRDAQSAVAARSEYESARKAA